MDVGARAVVWAHAKDVFEVGTTEEGCVLNLMIRRRWRGEGK